MGLEVDSNGLLKEASRDVITFRSPNGEGETTAYVLDRRDPHRKGPHREGDKVIEISIEGFGELMALIGFFPVDPRTNAIVIPDQLLADANEEYSEPQEEEDA